MPFNISQVKWSRIIISVIAVVLLSYLVTTLIITGYAFVLAFKARGTPDHILISQFAGRISAISVHICYLIFLFLATLWANRKSLPENMVHGLIIGILVVIIDIPLTYLFGQHLRLIDLFGYLLILGVGWAADQFCKKRSPKSKVLSPES
jgi:hypothetical protein